MTRLKRWGCLLLFLTLAMVGDMVCAQTAGTDRGQVLFVVDTSRSMSRYSAMTRQSVFDLVYDGVQGQMNAGDIYGIWIFNEKVYTNVFTPLNWDAQLNRGMATGASNFTRILHYEKYARLDRLWSALVGYARQTTKLTVVILTDGTDRFVGTPFDAQINTYFEKHSKEFRQAKKPFIITLAALDGKFLACTVNGARDPIAFDSIAVQVNEWKQGQPQYQTRQARPINPAPAVVIEAPAPGLIAPAPPIVPAAGPAAVAVVQTNPPVPLVIAEPARTEAIHPAASNAAPPAWVTPVPTPVASTSAAPVVATLETAPPVLQTSVPAVQVATPLPAKPTDGVPVEPAPEPRLEKPPGLAPPVQERRVESASTATVAQRAPAAVTKAPIDPAVKPVAALRFGDRNPGILIGFAIVLLGSALVLLVVFLRGTRQRTTNSFISQSIDRESRP